MDVGPTFVGHRQPVVAGYPRKSLLHYPAPASEPLAALYAPPSDPRSYATLAKEPSAARVVVSFVCMELVGSLARPASLALQAQCSGPCRMSQTKAIHQLLRAMILVFSEGRPCQKTPFDLGSEFASVERHLQGRDLAVLEVEPVSDRDGRSHRRVQVEPRQHVEAFDKDLLDNDVELDLRHALDPLHVFRNAVQVTRRNALSPLLLFAFR